MTEKQFDPYDFIDDDFIQAVVEVGESLPDWKPEGVKEEITPNTITPAEQKKKEIYQKMRELAAKADARRKR